MMNIGAQGNPTYFVTGGAGFIGSNFLNRFVPQFPSIRFINVDKLTYAGNLANLKSVSGQENYAFELVDIAVEKDVESLFDRYEPDAVFHFAADSHVDRSILSPRTFVETNVLGTFNLLEACRRSWTNTSGKLFHHVSTDEVYGSLEHEGYFTESTPYDPSSPYSASKAASDHLVRAYSRTFGLPVTITNCSNNYGPYQFPEKLIPLMILNAAEGKPLPVYGKGENVRDWLFVDDHCEAIWAVANRGKVGQTYNIGGTSEMTNMEVVLTICAHVENILGKASGSLAKQITHVADRPGHDFRYAIDASKVSGELGWKPSETFSSGIEKTVRWFLVNGPWVDQVRSGEYRNWLHENYSTRFPV